MSTHNIYFRGQIKQISVLFGWGKKQQKGVLSGARSKGVPILRTIMVANLLKRPRIAYRDV